MRTVTKIEPTMSQMPKRKRVAAYARVSVDSEQLLHSLSAQVSYYSNLIQKNPNWEYAGVYADEGISGTGTVKRKEFLRMIADCDAGKIDIILVNIKTRYLIQSYLWVQSSKSLATRGFGDFAFS